MRTAMLVIFIAAVAASSDSFQAKLATNGALLKAGAKNPQFALGYRAGYIAGCFATMQGVKT